MAGASYVLDVTAVVAANLTALALQELIWPDWDGFSIARLATMIAGGFVLYQLAAAILRRRASGGRAALGRRASRARPRCTAPAPGYIASP
jgi:hypothetical protein